MTEKTKETKNAQSVEYEKLRRAFNGIAKTEHGKTVLRYLKRDCGFAKTSLVMNPQACDINPIGSIYNEARKDVYHRIRQFIDVEFLKQIEYEEDKNV